MQAESAIDAWTSSGTQGTNGRETLTLVFRLLCVSFLHTLGALAGALRGADVVRIRIILLHALQKIRQEEPTCNIFLQILCIPK